MFALRGAFGGVEAATPDDAHRGLVAGDLARRAAARFLRIRIPPFLIAPPSTPIGGCGFLFPWRFGPSSPGSGRPPTHVLPHEIGHAVFLRYVIPRTRDDEYAGDAPDWLDEMAAVAFEDAEGVEARRGEARRHAQADKLIPLRRLLGMQHPEWIARVAGPIDSSSPVFSPASGDTPAFYATVRALLDLLIAKTGRDGVVRDLAEVVRAHQSVERWLVARLADGRDLEAVDAQMRAFVLNDQRFASPEARTQR